MDAVIGVASAEGFAHVISARVVALVKVFFTLATFTSLATPVARLLRQGATSLSAVSPDFNLNGGTAAA